MSTHVAVRWNGSLLAVFASVPVLGVGYQFCAEQLAQASASRPFGLGWISAVVFQPWMVALVALEAASFVAWMIVLARVSVSEAFPLTAVSYALVTALGWFGFHEPVRPLQIVGATAIAAGIYLLKRGGERNASR